MPDIPEQSARSSAIVRKTLLVALAPLLVYYLARACGAPPWLALTAAVLAAAAQTAANALRERKLDLVSAYMLAIFGVNLAVVLLTENPRLAMVINSVPSFVLALFLLVSGLIRKPATQGLVEKLRPSLREEELAGRGWSKHDISDYRATHTRLSVLSGAACLALSLLGLAFIMALPIDLSQLLNTVVSNAGAVLVVLLIVSRLRSFVKSHDRPASPA
jgi:intracellular septation protein A